MDIKRSHGPPLLRALAAKLAAADACDTWEEAGVVDQTLFDLGLPKKAAEILRRKLETTSF